MSEHNCNRRVTFIAARFTSGTLDRFKSNAHELGNECKAAKNTKLPTGIPPPSHVFAELEQMLQDRQLEFIKNHIGSYEIFERMMGFQCFLNNEVSEVHSQTPVLKNLSDQILTDGSVMFILQQNLLYLFSALRPLEQGAFHVYRALIRPVLESVPKCFFLIGHPESTREFLLAEAYDEWRASQQRQNLTTVYAKFLESDVAQWVLQGRKITSDQFAKFRKSHTNHQIREKVYEAATLRRQRSFYSALNTSLHANVLRSTPLKEEQFSEDEEMKILTDLSFFNLFLMVNSQHRTLRSLGLLEEAERFILDAQESLKFHLGITYLYPDKKECWENLILRPRQRDD